MNKFQDIPYHVALHDRATLAEYHWLVRQLENPEKHLHKQNQAVTTILRKLVHLMAGRKKNEEKSEKSNRANAHETIWLTVKLKDSDEAALSEYSITALQVIDDLLVLVAEGGSFTVKQSANDDSYNGYAFLPLDVESNRVYAVSAYALTPSDALLVLHYKLFVLVGNTPDKYLAVEKRRFG